MRRKRSAVVGTAAVLGIFAFAHADAATSQPPAAQIKDPSGRPVQVGDVIAVLRRDGGTCVGSTGVETVSADGAPVPDVTLYIDSTCRVIVADIAYPTDGYAEFPDTSSEGSSVPAAPGGGER